MYFDDVENLENNGTEEIGLVTPTPGVLAPNGTKSRVRTWQPDNQW